MEHSPDIPKELDLNAKHCLALPRLGRGESVETYSYGGHTAVFEKNPSGRGFNPFKFRYVASFYHNATTLTRVVALEASCGRGITVEDYTPYAKLNCGHYRLSDDEDTARKFLLEKLRPDGMPYAEYRLIDKKTRAKHPGRNIPDMETVLDAYTDYKKANALSAFICGLYNAAKSGRDPRIDMLKNLGCAVFIAAFFAALIPVMRGVSSGTYGGTFIFCTFVLAVPAFFFVFESAKAAANPEAYGKFKLCRAGPAISFFNAVSVILLLSAAFKEMGLSPKQTFLAPILITVILEVVFIRAKTMRWFLAGMLMFCIRLLELHTETTLGIAVCTTCAMGFAAAKAKTARLIFGAAFLVYNPLWPLRPGDGALMIVPDMLAAFFLWSLLFWEAKAETPEDE